jgi:hypothetical protein
MGHFFLLGELRVKPDGFAFIIPAAHEAGDELPQVVVEKRS